MTLSQNSIEVVGTGLGCAGAVMLAWITWETFPGSIRESRPIRRSFIAAVGLVFFGFMIPATYSIYKESGGEGIRSVLIMMGEAVAVVTVYWLYRKRIAAKREGARGAIDSVERMPGSNLFAFEMKYGSGHEKLAPAETKTRSSAEDDRTLGVGRKTLFMLLIAVWLIPAALAVILVVVLDKITHGAVRTDFMSSNLTTVSSDIVVFMGAFAAVLIAVLTWIHDRSQNSLESGFATVLDATNRLEMQAEQMRQHTSRAAPEQQPMLRLWSDSTDQMVEHLHEITVAWSGWEESRSLGEDLLRYAQLPTSLGLDVAAFLVTDIVWSKFRIDNDHAVRSLLVGLGSMDRGVVSEKLLARIVPLFVSLGMFITVTLVVRLLADMSISGFSNGLACVSIAGMLVFSASAHVLYPMWSVVVWWGAIRRHTRV